MIKYKWIGLAPKAYCSLCNKRIWIGWWKNKNQTKPVCNICINNELNYEN